MLVGFQTVPGHLVHGIGVQGNVRARPGIGGGGQVIGIGLPRHLEHDHLDGFSHRFPTGEPLALGPTGHHRFGVAITLLGQFRHVVEGFEHQQCVLELLCRRRRQFWVGQQGDQGLDVVTAVHIAQQGHRIGRTDQVALGFALGYGRQEAGLDVSRFINPRRNPGGQQFQQKLCLALRRVLQ